MKINLQITKFVQGKRGRKTNILDATPIMLDVNLEKNSIMRKS